MVSPLTIIIVMAVLSATKRRALKAVLFAITYATVFSAICLLLVAVGSAATIGGNPSSAIVGIDVFLGVILLNIAGRSLTRGVGTPLVRSFNPDAMSVADPGRRAVDRQFPSEREVRADRCVCRCGRGERRRNLYDDLNDVTSGVRQCGVACVGRAVVVRARRRLVFAELVAAADVRRVVCERGVVRRALQGDGSAADARRTGAQRAVDGEVVVDGCRGWGADGKRGRRAHLFGADGIDVAILAPHVNDAVGDGGGFNTASARVVPELRPGGGVEGVDAVVYVFS
jgi:hypothetical protein